MSAFHIMAHTTRLSPGQVAVNHFLLDHEQAQLVKLDILEEHDHHADQQTREYFLGVVRVAQTVGIGERRHLVGHYLALSAGLEKACNPVAGYLEEQCEFHVVEGHDVGQEEV